MLSSNKNEIGFRKKSRSRRDGIEITANILKLASHGESKTQIVKKANLNFQLANKYLRMLYAKKMIEVDARSGVYKTTHYGHQYIEMSEKIFEMINEDL